MVFVSMLASTTCVGRGVLAYKEDLTPATPSPLKSELPLHKKSTSANCPGRWPFAQRMVCCWLAGQQASNTRAQPHTQKETWGTLSISGPQTGAEAATTCVPLQKSVDMYTPRPSLPSSPNWGQAASAVAAVKTTELQHTELNA